MIPLPVNRRIAVNTLILAILVLLAAWIALVPPPESAAGPGADRMTGWDIGRINASLGCVLLLSYIAARNLKKIGLPMISGYIFLGMAAGPHLSRFLDTAMVAHFQIIDELALSFIAMTAGAELSLSSLRRRKTSIGLNILFLTVTVFSCVAPTMFFAFPRLLPEFHLNTAELATLSLLMGVIAVARSPSSAIAVIGETRSAGPFTETALGVTVAMDVLIILLFTAALSVGRMLLSPETGGGLYILCGLGAEISLSLVMGAALGKLVSLYIRKVGRDALLFLLVLAFGVTRAGMAISGALAEFLDFHLHLEPLLICMGCGFTVRNFTREGHAFMRHLERAALPIYLLFFTITGAALDMGALMRCWPLALLIFFMRILGIFMATWTAGKLAGDPPRHCKNAWMAYLTQAGVAVGLARMAAQLSPEVGAMLLTVVLAVITLNQMAGPITFKAALMAVGEAGAADGQSNRLPGP